MGRGVLLNFLDTDLYERQGQALPNFSHTLSAVRLLAFLNMS